MKRKKEWYLLGTETDQNKIKHYACRECKESFWLAQDDSDGCPICRGDLLEITNIIRFPKRNALFPLR